MSIEPTIGRIVWYTPSRENIEGRHFGALPLQALAAIVTYVHTSLVDNDTGRDVHYVNLCVFSQIGYPVSCERVLLRQPEDEPPLLRDYCEWMPYQVGQAAKNATPPASAPLPFDPATLNPSPPAPAFPDLGDAANAQPGPADPTLPPADEPRG